MSGLTSRNENRNRVSGLYTDPFQSLETRMNQFFRGVLDGGSSAGGLGHYPVDIDEDDDQFTIEAEMPGFKRDEVEVNVENGVLSIRAERKPKETGEKKRHLNGRCYTRVQRSFSLPRSVDGAGIDASMADGVLTLILKKTEASKPRKVEIRDIN